ncbi:MAG: glycoside hydrolase family 3 protein [Chlorobi bacterium]|nr:glycoside hydrolase family 3 protein [Chlorobiota bacterium]
MLFKLNFEQIEELKTSNNKEFSAFFDKSSDFIQKKLSKMSLNEKISQMIISSVVPENLNENSAEFKKLKKLCEVNKIGGFIFFKGSTIDYTRISNTLQSYSETPLLISADFERGTKMRVSDGALFPNNMAIGAANNPELCYKMGLEIARETRLLGVHQNYAPVCDVNNNPNNPIINVRSFGEDPALVSRMSEAMIKGLQEGKVIATAKHFPGHGDTEIDSHKDLPILNFSKERLNSVELVPFKNAVNKNVMSVMIAHLSIPELEPTPNVPASLSSNIVKELLINEMGFKGLVVTDALNMKGITKYFSTAEVAVMCVEAGIDLILIPLNEETTIDAIESAVINGKIPEEQINRSVEKILKAKEWLGLFENKYVQEADIWKTINTAEANQLAQQIADESVTLVKDDINILPIKESPEKTAFVVISEDGESDNVSYLSANTSQYLNNYDLISSEQFDISSSSYYSYIIVAIFAKVRYGTGKISISQENINLINQLSHIFGSTIVVSLGNPYLLKEFPSVQAYICAYGDSDVSINAALKALTGKIKFKGKLPVSIGENYKFGWGINK